MPTPMTTNFIKEALAQVGKPYEFGADGPFAFDCSGLVLYCLKFVGVTDCPRESSEQWAFCQPIPFADLEPGDLIFEQWPQDSLPAPGHVCIYIGNKQVVEAPHTGANVWVRGWSPTETTIVGYGRVAALDYPKPVATVKALLKESNGEYRVVCPKCAECFDVEP